MAINTLKRNDKCWSSFALLVAHSLFELHQEILFLDNKKKPPNRYMVNYIAFLKL